MKRNSQRQVVEMRASMTEGVKESPEEQLKYISSSNSFEGMPRKVVALTARREPFTLNGWENSRDRTARSSPHANRTKQFSAYSQTITSTLSRTINPESKRNFRTVESRPGRQPELNFKFGGKGARAEGNGALKAQGKLSARGMRESLRFKQQLNKEKLGLLQFYQNERVKRRLMVELAEPQEAISIIEYPLECSPRPPRTARKTAVYRRYFG